MQNHKNIYKKNYNKKKNIHIVFKINKQISANQKNNNNAKN